MTHRKPELIKLGKITTIEGVADELARLNDRLDSMRLNQFVLFNNSYYIVTTSIQKAIKDNFFVNPKFIQKFIVTFARYYFDALNNSQDENNNLAEPWLIAHDCAKNSGTRFISLMLGANAHINNDLPQVLTTLMANEKTEDLLSDIVKIDKLLMKSGREIITTFEETNKVLDLFKRRFQFLYYRPVMYMILYWRIVAWKNYRKLKKQPSYLEHITNRSVKIANRWLILSRFLG